MASTRVIDLPHDLPATPAERAADRNRGARPSRAQATLVRRGQPDTSSPGDAAPVALVRLLARQAAQEHMSEGK